MSTTDEKPVAKPEWLKRDIIPIRSIQFDPQKPQPIPGKMYSSSVTFNPERPKNQDHHTIVYIPAMRQYIVTHHPAGERPVAVRMVHESHVLCAEPLL